MIFFWRHCGIIINLLFLLTACSDPRVNTEIIDLTRMPQDLFAYVDCDNADQPLLPETRQRVMAEHFMERYLAPWHSFYRGRPEKELFGALDQMRKKTWFAGNLRAIRSEDVTDFEKRCARETFPGLDYPAVTLRAGNLRGLPSHRPAFLDFTRPGEGFPFDYLQLSAIEANTPVRVRHCSTDGDWLLVETAALYGWLPATDVAPVDENVIKLFSSASWLAMLQDNVALTIDGGQVAAIASLGSLWPYAAEGRVWVAIRDRNGRACLVPARLPPETAAPFPLPLVPKQMAALGNRLLGMPYGWGGLFRDRDCSATMQDLFRPFGIYLPRNSSDQIRAGAVISLADYPPRDREAAVRDRGVPWLTLVWLRGHVMLYVGNREGRVALLHTLWGLKTRNWLGEEGRHLIGRTVITGLQPGYELSNLARPDGELCGRIQGMTILR